MTPIIHAKSVYRMHTCLITKLKCMKKVNQKLIKYKNMKIKFGLATTAQSKRVIHEYHRITVPADKVVSNGIIILKALPTCLQFATCESCANATLNYFTCSWCKPEASDLGFCSDEDG